MDLIPEDNLQNIFYFLEPKLIYSKLSNVNKKWRETALITLINPINILQDVFDKEVAGVYSEKAKNYFHQKKYEDSIYYYSQSIQLDPTNPRSFANRSLCFTKQQLYQKAFDDINISLKLDETWSKTYLQKAILLKKTSHEEEGKIYLQKAIDLSGNINFSEMFIQTKSETYFDFKIRENQKVNLTPCKLDYYVADISTICNLCYIPIDKFFRKFDYQFGETFINFSLTASFVFDDFMFLKIAKLNPQIKSLNISGCVSISLSAIMYSIKNYFKKLKYLDIRNIPRLQIESIEMIEKNYEIEIIHSIYEDVLDTDYHSNMKKFVTFEENGLELAKILKLNDKQINDGISIQELNSISKILSYEWHPDLNSLGYLLNQQSLSIMNDLMEDLNIKVENSFDSKIVYTGKEKQEFFLQIGN